MDANKQKLIAARDQVWADARRYLADIQRIGLTGIENEADAKIAAKMCLLVSAELYCRSGNEPIANEEVE